MRIAILSDDSYSYSKPMAISLNKMFNQLNIKNKIFYNGTKGLNYKKKKNLFEYSKELIKIIINFFVEDKYIIPSFRDLLILKKKLTKFDAIIICAHIPASLAKNYYQGIYFLRKYLKIPIINYDLHFLATMEGKKFIKMLNTESRWGGFSGFDRFDYYLTASNISENPVKKIFWPVSIIGGNFTNKYLQAKQKKFIALIDFKRKNYLAERKMQIEILKKLNIPYTILSKKYEHSKIYKIYSKHSIYFLAHRESFGLPIVELQNCGCYIFTPYKKWAPSHYINKSIYSRGEGNLSKNFIIYNNDPLLLEKKIKKIKSNYLAKKVIYVFKKKNGNLYKGNLKILDSVIKKIKTGKINYNSHLKYKELHKHILE
jgi:hypothetical protein